MSVFVGEGDLGSMRAPGGDVDLPVNLGDVERWVAQLPLSLRELLARGPVDEDEGHAAPCCTVCRMLDVVDNQGRSLAVANYLEWWHTDADSRTPEEKLASYLRCLLIYLEAGWSGVHAELLVRLACSWCGKLYPAEHTDVTHGSDCCSQALLVCEFEDQKSEVPLWASPVVM